MSNEIEWQNAYVTELEIHLTDENKVAYLPQNPINIRYKAIHTTSYWSVRLDGAILCANCFGECPIDRKGHYIETRYCPHCGAEMEE